MSMMHCIARGVKDGKIGQSGKIRTMVLRNLRENVTEVRFGGDTPVTNWEYLWEWNGPK